MTITEVSPGFYKASDYGVSLFFGNCAEGCRWNLEPDYQQHGFRGRHSTNPEAVQSFPHVEPFDPAALLDALWAWLDRCHAYERGEQAS